MKLHMLDLSLKGMGNNIGHKWGFDTFHMLWLKVINRLLPQELASSTRIELATKYPAKQGTGLSLIDTEHIETTDQIQLRNWASSATTSFTEMDFKNHKSPASQSCVSNHKQTYHASISCGTFWFQDLSSACIRSNSHLHVSILRMYSTQGKAHSTNILGGPFKEIQYKGRKKVRR